MRKSKFIFVLIICAGIIISCDRGCRDDDRNDGEEKSEKVEKKKKQKKEDNIENRQKMIYGVPASMPGSSQMLLPVRFVSTDEDFLTKFKREYFDGESSGVKYSFRYALFNFQDLVNVVFWDKITGQGYPLLNERRYISKFYFPDSVSADTSSMQFILYALVDKPFEDGEYYSDDDGETIFISDIAGRNSRQITPNNIRLLNWEADRTNDILFLTITSDSDNDDEFTYKDDIKILRTSIRNPQIGTEIITDSLNTSIKKLYSDD